MADLADVDDLVTAWRSLTDEEVARAAALIARASRRIRARWPDVDARIETGTLDPEAVSDVVLEMVQVAMTQPPGVSQTTETAGPFSQGVTYANPNARLYFTDDMVAVFDGVSTRRVYQAWLA